MIDTLGVAPLVADPPPADSTTDTDTLPIWDLMTSGQPHIWLCGQHLRRGWFTLFPN